MSKTVRVEIETDDGKLAILTGEAADVWQSQIDHASGMAVAHGSQFVRLPWQETTRVMETPTNNPMYGLYDNLTSRLHRVEDVLSKVSLDIAEMAGSIEGMVLCSKERDSALRAMEIAVETTGGNTVRIKGGALDREEVAAILRENDVGHQDR